LTPSPFFPWHFAHCFLKISGPVKGRALAWKARMIVKGATTHLHFLMKLTSRHYTR